MDVNFQPRLFIFIAAFIAVLFIFFPQFSVYQLASVTEAVITEMDDYVILFSTVVLVICFALCISPLGKTTLGDEAPEFGIVTWLVMLFTTGMGSGLVFWGVAEPIYHFSNMPPITYDGDPKDAALGLTYFHWGIHAWGLYALAGLLIGWQVYINKRPMRISASLSKSERPKWLAIVDLIAVLAILFGIAGVLANTMALVEQGIRSVTGIEQDLTAMRVVLTVVVGTLFMVSSALGLKKGIKRLSCFNMWLMVAIFGFVLVNVDIFAVAGRMVSSITAYIVLLPQVSLAAIEGGEKWSQGWTVIYLIWWISWAPFVGPFIARISRGRTVRQFLICTIFIPTLASIMWFSGFAGAVFESSYLTEVVQAVNQDYTKGLFTFFAQLPMSDVLSTAALLLLLTFVISSSDSAIYSACMLMDDTRTSSKICWSVIVVTMGIALAIINNVDLNKQVAIVGAIPFILVMITQILVVVYHKIVFWWQRSQATYSSS
ncbi:BCCT family transporter [Photobacterium kishitanii]|uniref:BCCT transporter n=1 Tax=Photobacterium kishitanii TaxID=318456 RepID=A0A2T3KKH0_9GAMM|nr:BCCT family transporter [Photobacterium kishitanii]PSV00018.1 BCCT transporter [Photobacterium kishitanii]